MSDTCATKYGVLRLRIPTESCPGGSSETLSKQIGIEFMETATLAEAYDSIERQLGDICKKSRGEKMNADGIIRNISFNYEEPVQSVLADYAWRIFSVMEQRPGFSSWQPYRVRHEIINPEKRNV